MRLINDVNPRLCFEELLAADENTIPTYHDKIMIAKDPTIDYTEVKAQIVRLLNGLVPEYISNNSVFEKLDKVK